MKISVDTLELFADTLTMLTNADRCHLDSTHKNALAREKAERLARLADAYRAGTLTDWEYLAAVQRVLDL